MANELKTNLEAILNEKTTKILPENIKKDVQIFDIVGTYDCNITADFSLNPANTEMNRYITGVYCKPNAFITITNAKNLFAYAYNLKHINYFDSSNMTNMAGIIRGCAELTELPFSNTSNATTTGYMCYSCGKLINVPELNLSNATNAENMFANCPSLSDESLNNILKMCISATKISTKTLAYIGLTSEQATICTSLSNYQAFLDAGWTTGY